MCTHLFELQVVSLEASYTNTASLTQQGDLTTPLSGGELGSERIEHITQPHSSKSKPEKTSSQLNTRIFLKGSNKRSHVTYTMTSKDRLNTELDTDFSLPTLQPSVVQLPRLDDEGDEPSNSIKENEKGQLEQDKCIIDSDDTKNESNLACLPPSYESIVCNSQGSAVKR